jgi:UDP-N-acetylmuramate dehydrogenase
MSDGMLVVDAGFETRVKRNEPMSRHTSWHVGGPADVYFSPRDRAELLAFLATLPEGTPLLWLGLGSNLLVRDGGIRGVVIDTQSGLTRLERVNDTTITCEAGVPCARIARQCIKWGLTPAEFLAGIPGTLGGALAMNAGAFGGETWDRVVSVETIDRSGARRERPRDDFTIGYRSVDGPAGEWFLGASFEFTAIETGGADEIRALLRERADKQPLGLPSAGSVFRNPAGGHAGELIERAGLKGLRRGGAVVADKHANFIINAGGATAADIEGLIGEVRLRVRDATGIELEPEVRIIGEPEAGA